MATPPKVSASPRPLAGAAGTVKATKPPKVGAAKGGPRGGKAKGGTPNSGGGEGGGYNPNSSWADVPD